MPSTIPDSIPITPEFKGFDIQATVKKADKGEFVSSKAMRAWFASLGTDYELPRPEPDVFLKAK